MKPNVIMLLSSDPDAEGAVRAALEITRHEMRQFASDYGAMAHLHAGCLEVALAIVDLDPGLHGIELCRAAAQHVPVIALLPAGDAALAEQAREHGASICLQKPVDAGAVQAMIEEVLGVRAPMEL